VFHLTLKLYETHSLIPLAEKECEEEKIAVYLSLDYASEGRLQPTQTLTGQETPLQLGFSSRLPHYQYEFVENPHQSFLFTSELQVVTEVVSDE
jgi:hypothetical protein